MISNDSSLDRCNAFDKSKPCSQTVSFLSDISKYLNVNSNKSTSKNVELGLEIEIDESVQQVLVNNDSSGSSQEELLAVTIINPSESDIVHETTVALNKEDVREFISLVQQHRVQRIDDYEETTKKYKTNSETSSRKVDVRRKRKEEEKRSEEDGDLEEDSSWEREIKREREKWDRKLKKAKIQRKEKERREKGYQKEEEKRKDAGKREKSKDRKSKSSRHNPSSTLPPTYNESPQVYTTINTVDKLRECLPCQNRSRSEKAGSPCVCQNCGIMDVLVQSQKGPVVEFPPLEDVRQPVEKDERRKDRHRRERSSSKEQKPSRCSESFGNALDVELLKEIYARVNSLEKRITIQEERAVSRDYLKHVLHRIFSQYQPRSE